MGLMNKKLCEETKKRKKWRPVMCGMCSHYEKCITRQDYEFKHDETREMQPLESAASEEFNNPVECH